MFLIALLCMAGADVGPMIALTIVAAAAGTFSFPAQASLTPELATDDAELGRANAVFATLDSVGCVVGPGLAGILIATGGLPIAFALNGLSFGAVAIALIIWRPLSTDVGGPSPATSRRRCAGKIARWPGLLSFDASADRSPSTVPSASRAPR